MSMCNRMYNNKNMGWKGWKSMESYEELYPLVFISFDLLSQIRTAVTP